MGYNIQGFIGIVRGQFSSLEMFTWPDRLQFLSNGEHNLVGKCLHEVGVRLSKCLTMLSG